MKTLSSLRAEAESMSDLWFCIMHDKQALDDRRISADYAANKYNYFEGMLDAYNNASCLIP